ncbi:hypothetical protein C3941_09280 [Kaistia algarum]|uniref:hypothetical protein n=1 Tax=Kaistia algarum TaxID=2083279 RepID=UPI000CE9066F|nr:hypothetical protein [Kaistia algarum]MCX5512251.1 hypothetical protein [Kaistia algarum]PPE80343.1 hypothetical protein C3941_09280 [Kaistia algarum]
MAVKVENVTRPLAEAGCLEWSSADLYDRAGEIVITLRFTTPELASEAYDTIAAELQQDNFRLGSLNIQRGG